MAAALVADGALVAVAAADRRQALALIADLAMRRNVPAEVPIEGAEQPLKNPTGVQLLV
jgi:hypothetical protein